MSIEKDCAHLLVSFIINMCAPSYRCGFSHRTLIIRGHFMRYLHFAFQVMISGLFIVSTGALATTNTTPKGSLMQLPILTAGQSLSSGQLAISQTGNGQSVSLNTARKLSGRTSYQNSAFEIDNSGTSQSVGVSVSDSTGKGTQVNVLTETLFNPKEYSVQ